MQSAHIRTNTMSSWFVNIPFSTSKILKFLNLLKRCKTPTFPPHCYFISYYWGNICVENRGDQLLDFFGKILEGANLPTYWQSCQLCIGGKCLRLGKQPVPDSGRDYINFFRNFWKSKSLGDTPTIFFGRRKSLFPISPPLTNK